MKAKTTPPADPLPLWWVSFCDTSLPTGQHFVGVVIVRAADMKAAYLAARDTPGSPTHGCQIDHPHYCESHRHIDVAMVESHQSQEYRIEHLQGRFVPREEVLAMAGAVTVDDYQEYSGE